uniref:Uncharacterized protein n=2 Tax=Lutzomyia longipalpis TaxID=7200 RepID=A0A1B0CJG0_LUTLO
MVPMLLRTTLRQQKQPLSRGRGKRAIESSVGPRHCHSAIDFELEINEDPLDNMNCSGVVFPSGPLTNSTNVTLDSNPPTSTPASLQGCEAANCGLCQTELNVSFTPALSQILLAPTSSTGPIFTTDGDNSTTGEVINSFYFYE